MIVFGSIVSAEADPYLEYAQPGIRVAAEPDSEVLALASSGSIARGCNLLLDTAAAFEDLEALVVVHAHARITDPTFCTKLRAALTDPEVAVVGCAGARGDRLDWWEGEVHTGSDVRVRFEDHGGGEMPAYAFATPGSAPAEVDALDGFLLALSPWAVRNLRFDEDYWLNPAFDVDFCRQVRAAGRKLLVADIGVVFHRSLELVGDPDPWMLAHQRLAMKWEVALDDDEYKPRARRAEAAREAIRSMGGFTVLASNEHVEALERQMQALTSSLSWRLTAPLRRVNRLFRREPSQIARLGEGAADLVARDRRLIGSHSSPLAQPGEPLGHPEGTRLK